MVAIILPSLSSHTCMQVHITGHRLNTAPVYITSTPLQRSISHDSNSVDSEASSSTSSSSGQQSHALLGVEGYAISYYTTEVGWPCALHTEGSCFMTLFALLMWDEIFASGIPDVFRTKFQVMAIIIMCRIIGRCLLCCICVF